MHQLLNPMCSKRVAPAPSVTPISDPRQTANEDIFGLTSSPVMTAGAKANPASTTNSAQDIMGLFGNFDISNQSPNPLSSAPNHSQNSVAQLPIRNGQVPTPSHQTLASNTAISNNSFGTRSHVAAVQTQNPFSQVPTPKIQAENFVAQYPHAPPQQTAKSPVDRNASQGSHTTHVPRYSHSIPHQQVTSTNTPIERKLSRGSHEQQTHVPEYSHAAPQQIPFASQSIERNLSQGPQTQQGHVPRYSNASQQHALLSNTSVERNMSQASLAQQTHVATGAPFGYGNAPSQKSNGSIPPQQNNSLNTHMNHYQSNSLLQYNPATMHSGLPSQGGYSMEPQQQQNNQVRDHKHPNSQAHQQQQHSYPPSQQHYVTKQLQSASTQTVKPNLSQFDPFQ